MERWLVSGAMDGLPSRPLSLECCNLYYLMPLCLTKPPRRQLVLTFMTAFLKLDTDFRNTLGMHRVPEALKLVLLTSIDCKSSNSKNWTVNTVLQYTCTLYGTLLSLASSLLYYHGGG